MGNDVRGSAHAASASAQRSMVSIRSQRGTLERCRLEAEMLLDRAAARDPPDETEMSFQAARIVTIDSQMKKLDENYIRTANLGFSAQRTVATVNMLEVAGHTADTIEAFNKQSEVVKGVEKARKLADETTRMIQTQETLDETIDEATKMADDAGPDAETDTRTDEEKAAESARAKAHADLMDRARQKRAMKAAAAMPAVPVGVGATARADVPDDSGDGIAVDALLGRVHGHHRHHHAPSAPPRPP